MEKQNANKQFINWIERFFKRMSCKHRYIIKPESIVRNDNENDYPFLGVAKCSKCGNEICIGFEGKDTLPNNVFLEEKH